MLTIYIFLTRPSDGFSRLYHGQEQRIFSNQR